MSDPLEPLARAGVLSPLDVHFARAMARIGDDARPEVVLAAALASRHVAEGHVCLDLSDTGPGPVLIDADGRSYADALPARAPWRAALRASPLVAAGEERVTPLVLDADGRLYLRRYWDYERTLAHHLGTRATTLVEGLALPLLRDGLARLFPRTADADRGEPDWQRVAAFVALRRRLCVISGGPGTGKTSTVVKILALGIEQAQAAGRRLPRVRLLAPTGKAAARLTEAIRAWKSRLPCAPVVRAAVPEETSTIHRALGAAARGPARFRFDARTPLLTDLVVVDEASMVDLALMARLLDAVPADASVILIGDKDQLSSVEAGAVLGDVCDRGASPRSSAGFAREIAAATGETLPNATAHAHGGIWDCIVELTRSYRYDRASGIARLARAVRAGDAPAALAVLASPEHPDVTRVPPPRHEALSPSLDALIREGFAPALRGGAPALRLRALDRMRLLCAHRRGPFGVADVNRAVEHLLAAAGLLHLDGSCYTGRPLVVTRNDYALGLFNGDVGLIIDPGDGGGRLAFFLAPDGSPRLLSPARLPPSETAFATSVHKSQGSEFEHVVVIFPREPSPVLSRELLYTAVTRARSAVTIQADEPLLVRAIAAPISRASGLRRRLWAGA